jgi:hypothetical protein
MLGGMSRSTPNGNRNEPRSLCVSSPLTALPKAEKTNRSPASIDAQFTRSYSLTTALAPFTLRVWLTICLWAALFV